MYEDDRWGVPMAEETRAFSALQQAAAALNQQTQLLNQTIADIEKSIYDLNLGFTLWMDETPIDGPAHGEYGKHLGWTKTSRGEWGLYLRFQSAGSSHAVQDIPSWRLRDASRDDRMLALDALPDFIVALRAEAERVLKELQKTNAANALRALRKA